MKIISIILGILVILGWLYVIGEYKYGNQKTKKAQNVMVVAFVLTLILTILQFF
ncbi:hypothetical protein [Staphylococcus nepalensis]|uniref:hypothetical protein n=1 Tax=Staphylococcus nepalensis TaxID=214473 RepID=UPI0031BB5BFC